MVGRAVGLLLDVLNPESVVVTEIGVIGREDCLTALREAVGPERAADVRPTSFPDSVLATAGGTVALDVLYRDPLGATARTTEFIQKLRMLTGDTEGEDHRIHAAHDLSHPLLLTR
ncbi:hypothetical protein SALBM311S_04016 [Streptomyces alboniger]